MCFPQLERFGFACGVCHVMGTALTHGNKVLQVMPMHNDDVLPMPKFEELLLGRHVKAIHQCCKKGHYLMAFEYTQGFGVSCIHCKEYSLMFAFNGRAYEIRVTRELERNDPHVHSLRGPVPELPAVKTGEIIH
jgi:hypothetical protein